MPRASTAHFPPPAKAAPAGAQLVNGGNRPADVVAFENAMVDFFVGAADLLGVPKSVAAIYGIVFASPLPVSFADIEARLDISKGSISQGLRVLRDIGALREVSAASDRAELFTPDLELRKLIQRFLELRLQQQLDAGRGRLAALGRTVPGRNGEAEILRKRLKHLQSWHDKAHALLPVVRAFLKLGG
ncbi:MAG: hypothetical protein JWQ62_168 [Lacunisphaera sp.]|nr:hypothetical protein [Lacunisphaera sp.]